MKRRRFVQAASACAMALVVNGAAAGDGDVSHLFGARVVDNARFKSPYLTADLDGDGVVDRIYIVIVKRGSSENGFAKDATVISGLWHSEPLGASGEDFALAIVLAKGERKFVLTAHEPAGADYFDSPIWSVPSIPLTIATRGSKQFLAFQKQEPRIMHDAVVVGSEAGIDTALYWNGKTFALFEPPEEP